MLLLRASLLFVSCGWLRFATLVAAAARPPHIHEVRQGVSINTSPPKAGPGPASLPPQTSPTSSTSTMSPTSASPSSSGSPASPSSSPGNLNFGIIQNMSTCTSGSINWYYSGGQAELLLSATNINVHQSNSDPRFEAGQITAGQTIDQLLADTDAALLSWTWPSVNLPQGWYEIQGSIPNFSNVSSQSFFIANGSDISCLVNTSPQSSAALPSASISTSASTDLSESNVTGIVGGVVGAVVASIVLAAIFLWFRRRRRSSVRGVGLGRKGGRWGSLNSRNSNAGGSIRQLTSNHFRDHSESAGGMQQDFSGGKVSATTTPGGSDEDVRGEEKLVSSASPGINPFEILDTPVRYDRRASIYSLQSPTTVAESSQTRTDSVRTSNQSLEQQAHRIRSSMESSLYLRSERLSMPILPPTAFPRTPTSPSAGRSKDEYPPSPVAPSPVNRSVSAGTGSITRRTARKPVPQYDPVELGADSASTAPDTVSVFTAAAETSHSHGTGVGTEAPSELSHKASFGNGRPVHYLIPDMPAPQRD
ncbi:hypothetical protein PAXRUDRAFT_830150 [Paxillus rubicundulus Ve08.2h10]|uniref:Unplaced genomic scaffold scaffold_479, whole genome shotgun sequence n=1 Tax=Paxillus rubicundulus Ve08.2h10 TaxID=930991 RepID=A0A0D0D634_9AGAM|nr:hypothetical protein PAXRUDRAFT_830150 [Paxillus rubicundulus Ve08.2h10]